MLKIIFSIRFEQIENFKFGRIYGWNVLFEFEVSLKYFIHEGFCSYDANIESKLIH